VGSVAISANAIRPAKNRYNGVILVEVVSNWFEKIGAQGVGNYDEGETEGKQPDVEFTRKGLAEDKGASSKVGQVAQTIRPK
jgi:hypothetical protein